MIRELVAKNFSTAREDVLVMKIFKTRLFLIQTMCPFQAGSKDLFPPLQIVEVFMLFFRSFVTPKVLAALEKHEHSSGNEEDEEEGSQEDEEKEKANADWVRPAMLFFLLNSVRALLCPNLLCYAML